MKLPLPLLFSFLLTSSCERVADPVASTNTVQAPSTATGDKDAAATSIMRPEVAEETAAPPPPPPPEPLRELITFTEPGAALNEAARTALDALVANSRFHSGGGITLSGHSDSSGDDADNLAVSRRRAEAVRDYLIAKGVPAERMTLIALGERRPIEPNAHPDGSDYEEGMRRNRRVEIIVAPTLEATPGEAGPLATDD